MELKTLNATTNLGSEKVTTIAYGIMRVLKHELYGAREEGISWEDKNREFLSEDERLHAAAILREIELTEGKPLAQLSEQQVQDYITYISRFSSSLRSNPSVAVRNEAEQLLQQFRTDS